MPSFEYQAVNASGESVRGTIIGPSLTAAADQLAQQGLQVDQIAVAASINDPLAAGVGAAASAGPGTSFQAEQRWVYEPSEQKTREPKVEDRVPPIDPRSYLQTSLAGPMVGGVPLSKLMFFFRQFATMLHAGVPMVQSLDTLSNQAGNAKLSEIVMELRGHVQAGRPISAGMQRYPEVFSPLHMSMVRTGEEAGMLPQVLNQLSDYIEQEIRLRNLYKKATFMPKLTVIASVFIIVSANWFIRSVGRGKEIYSPLTEIGTWIVLGPLLVGAYLFFTVGLANPAIKYRWDAFILKIPYVGTTLQQFAMAKFGRAFGALYKGGVSIPKSISLAADSCGNEYLRAQIHPAARRLESGANITETLRSTGAFSPLVLDMMDTGERTGNLDYMLNKVSEYYEDEGEVRSRQTGHVLGVVTLLLVAIYVLYILITFYTTYFSGALEQAEE